MNKILPSLLLIIALANSALADETSFRRVKVPNLKGKQTNAILTFSDNDKAIEVRPAKGDPINIPYSAIDKCSYEFTKKHRITTGAIVFLAVSMAGGIVIMATKSKSHWLEIDYHQPDSPVTKVFVLRMHKREYIPILEALKTHTGIDAEILGNANKR